MSPKKIYMRKNLDPNPISKLVEYPERFLRKKKIQVDIGISLVDGSISLPKEGVIGVEDLEFEEKFEQSLFRPKSDSNLSQIVFDLERFNTFIPRIFSKEEKEEFCNSLSTRLKEKLEHIESL